MLNTLGTQDHMHDVLKTDLIHMINLMFQNIQIIHQIPPDFYLPHEISLGLPCFTIM